MRDSIEHRGPDAAAGVLLSSQSEPPVAFDKELFDVGDDMAHDIGLGHRRLAIIDLDGGKQPMSSADGRIWLVYNGEIYNYRELRRGLIAAGHEFRTESDTEVVLRAYEHYGDDCTAYLNGIFAFAIWDGRKRRLLLSRDHFGVKPLYYAHTSRGVVFGSEVKAILASGLVSPAVDVDALGLALTFRYTPSPATLFRGVKKLVPGASVVIESDHHERHRFVDYASNEPGARVPSWERRLASEIDHAVRRQMISDVPIGLSLSSGVDSSTLLAVMSRWSTEPVRAFTVGFGHNGRDDEIPLAQQVAHRFSAEFRAEKLGGDEYSAFMQKYMWHMEEPVGNQSAPAYYFVAAMAREAGVKVLLTGQGPDEMFAGYDRHVGIAFARVLRTAARPSIQTHVRRATRGREIGEKYLRFLTSASQTDLAQRLHAAYSVFSREDARTLLRPDVYASIDWSLSLAHVDGWLQRAPAGTDLERMLWIDARTLLADNLLLAEDKMAMAASVEARVPFLDLEFTRLAESVPGAMKLKVGRRKHVYRRACAQWIGSEPSRRRKIGFVNPMADWFRGNYQSSVLAPLGDSSSFLATYAQPAAVEQMVREHQEHRRDHTRKLYFLASLEAWYDTFCR
jgi:asparagine synthase (glutamine-hydrolysing)